MLAIAAALWQYWRVRTAMRQLLDAENRQRSILGSAMDAIVTVNAEQRVVIFNGAAERMFGLPAESAIGSHLNRFVPARHRAAHESYVKQFGTTGVTHRSMGKKIELAGLRADGSEFPIDVSISQTSVNGKKLYTAVIRDTSERKRATDALEAVREQERAKLAQELYEGLGQPLTALKMEMADIDARVRHDAAAPTRDVAHRANLLVDSLVDSVRRLASELRPPMLDDLGLVPALEWLADDFAAGTGIDVALDLDDVEPSPVCATALYRIAQESLTNVRRHAHADRVAISLYEDSGMLTLTVSDNGIGMRDTTSPSLAPHLLPQQQALGLLSIRERAIHLGGNAQVVSHPGEGVRLAVSVPLAPTARNVAR